MAALPSSRKIHIDPSLYDWQQSPSNPNTYQRRALGFENKWVHQSAMYRQMFLSGIISLKIPLTRRDFMRAAETAWLGLRFQHPEVMMVCRLKGASGDAVAECVLPEDENKANEWAKRSLTFSVGHKIDGGGHLRVETELRALDINDPVCLRLLTHEVEDSERLSEASYAFCVDHQCMDGTSAYLVADCFFHVLAAKMESKEHKAIDWRQCAENLAPPWISIMNDKQLTEGETFDHAVQKNVKMLVDSAIMQWGLKVMPAGNRYEPRSIHRSFPVDESAAILRSVKEKLGPSYTITSIGHAAVFLTMLKMRSPRNVSMDQRLFYSPVFMSGRLYLHPGHANSIRHVPMVRAIGIVEFHDVEDYILSDAPSKEEVMKKLRRGCEEALESYQAIRKRESALTESFGLTEYLATLQGSGIDRGVAPAFFISDGVVEQYMSREYPKELGIRKILSLDDVRFTANPDGAPLNVRMSSFRDIITLSAEWDAAHHSEEEVKRFLDCTGSLISSFV